MGILCGLDLVEIARVERAMERRGDAFRRKVYTPSEQAYCESRGKARYASYAARFSAKEALSKALGTGIAAGVTFLDIEVVSDERGKPSLILHGHTKQVFEALGGKSLALSLTHCRDYAGAQVVIETEADSEKRFNPSNKADSKKTGEGAVKEEAGHDEKA